MFKMYDKQKYYNAEKETFDLNITHSNLINLLIKMTQKILFRQDDLVLHTCCLYLLFCFTVHMWTTA